MSHSHDKLRAERDEETRYEENCKICRDEVSLTAVALEILCCRLQRRLGVSDLQSRELVDRLEDRHRIRAADMLSDAFNPGVIHSMMRDCTQWGPIVIADQDFQAIYEQLKSIGVEK